MTQSLKTAKPTLSETKNPDEGIDWEKYAPHFDLMAELIPAYQENVNALKEHVLSASLGDDATVVDLGAGTGIFSKAVAECLPESKIFHIDFDPTMNAIARQKYEEADLGNIEILEESIQRVDFPPESVDLVVCINALYAVHPQEAVALKIRKWLKPGATLFIIDFGRKQSAIDWGLHFLGNAIRGRNIRKYFQFLLFGQQITRQAMKGRKAQENKQYWMHSTEEFGEFFHQCGFEVENVKSCYRGYADLAICRKRH